LGRNMHDQIHHSRNDGTVYPENECQIFRAFRKGEGTHVTDEVLWRADGTSFPAEYWSYPQRQGNNILGSVVTFIDITESKRAEEKLRLAQTSVEQASDAVGNAVKFTEAGGIELRVSLAARSGSRLGLSVQVEDSGVGILAVEQSKLFQPFVQTQSGLASHSGTGLGLAICREYVHLMGGEIAVLSEPGKGSIFKFEVPVQPDTAEEPAAPAPGRVIGLSPGQALVRVLIVDDQPHARGWIAELLKSIGFEIREAERGDVAIRVWREWKPQLILMDVYMPGMNGLEASLAIKAEAHEQPPVIIALTASATDAERDAIMRSGGVDDFLSKPCREGELLERVRVHLNLQYRSAGGQAELEMAGRSAPKAVTGAELLAELPADWIDQLHEAVLSGEKDLLDQLIRAVGKLDARAARALQKVADEYEYDTLARWFEEAAEARVREAELL